MTQTDAQIDPVRVAREAVAATRYGEQDKAAVLNGDRDKYPAMELALVGARAMQEAMGGGAVRDATDRLRQTVRHHVRVILDEVPLIAGSAAVAQNNIRYAAELILSALEPATPQEGGGGADADLTDDERKQVEIREWLREDTGTAQEGEATPGRRDHRYRPLSAGETIEAGDECLTERHIGWQPARHCIGEPAPDPAYTSHRMYRRLKQPNPAPETGSFDGLVTGLRAHITALGVGCCSCGVKTFQAQHHDANCKVRNVAEALDNVDDLADTIAALQQRVAELEQEASDYADERTRDLSAALDRATAAEAERDALREALTEIANAYTAHGYSDAIDAVQALKDTAREALK